MKQSILSLITGLSFGGIFALLKLPIPAPNTFSGLLGIVGLFLGYMLTQRFFIPS
jgi:XapX domain-containing protein